MVFRGTGIKLPSPGSKKIVCFDIVPVEKEGK